VSKSFPNRPTNGFLKIGPFIRLRLETCVRAIVRGGIPRRVVGAGGERQRGRRRCEKMNIKNTKEASGAHASAWIRRAGALSKNNILIKFICKANRVIVSACWGRGLGSTEIIFPNENRTTITKLRRIGSRTRT